MGFIMIYFFFLLLIAPDESFSITLSFTKMDTECSYDHVFIYDGESYTSPLLGSFSGNTTPPSVTAIHGSVSYYRHFKFSLFSL